MTRICGACQLCCKLLPVSGLPSVGRKEANERCAHSRVRHGCVIYDRRPNACRLWSCRWLVGDDTDDLARPDRSHCIIDVMPEFIKVRDDATGIITQVPSVQIWCDPKFRDAYAAPALRAYLLRRGKEGMVAIIRYGAREGFVLFPPNLSSDGMWHAVSGEFEAQHSVSDIMDVCTGRTGHVNFS